LHHWDAKIYLFLRVLGIMMEEDAAEGRSQKQRGERAKEFVWTARYLSLSV